MRLKDKVAVVTGAHRGIGFAIADALAREGASVLAADIIAKRPEFVGNSVDYMAMDVSLPSHWDDVEARLRRKPGCLDILVHRFQSSNHIKRRCRVYRTKYGRQGVG